MAWTPRSGRYGPGGPYYALTNPRMPSALPLLILTALLATDPAPEGDTVCGPRCVQALLRSYGHDVELIDLVRELHTDGVEQGTTLGQMRDALRSRGLHAEVVHLPEGATLTWPEPAILRLKPLPTQASRAASAPGVPPQPLGHFLIHLGDNAGTATIHDPLTGTLHGPSAELRSQMSGDLLLVSQNPIPPATEFAEAARHPWPPSVIVLCTLCALGAILALWHSRQSLFRSRRTCLESA